MFNKKFLSLIVGYILGGTVASIYNKKTPGELEKEIKKSKTIGEKELSLLLDNFIDTHKNLLESFKQGSIYKKNKTLIEKKKKDFLHIIEGYKKQAKVMIDEIKLNGKDYIIETSDKLEKLYKEKKQEIEGLKDIAPEKIDELKSKLLTSYKDIKEKIKENSIKQEPVKKTPSKRMFSKK